MSHTGRTVVPSTLRIPDLYIFNPAGPRITAQAQTADGEEDMVVVEVVASAEAEKTVNMGIAPGNLAA